MLLPLEEMYYACAEVTSHTHLKTCSALVLIVSVVTAVAAGPLLSQWYGPSNLRAIPLRSVGDIFSFCNKTKTTIEILSLQVIPDPPKLGQDITVKAKVNLTEELTDGNVEVKVYFNNSPLVDTTFDFCGILNELFGLTCPLKAGIYDDLSTTQTIPGYLPSGAYNGSADASDVKGNQLLCVAFQTEL